VSPQNLSYSPSWEGARRRWTRIADFISTDYPNNRFIVFLLRFVKGGENPTTSNGKPSFLFVSKYFKREGNVL
jgi:hypothetical protein